MCVRTSAAALAIATILLAAGADGSLAAGASYGFALDITLSPKAAAKLAMLKEKIIVSVSWLGDAGAKAPKKEVFDGQVQLGAEEITIPGTDGHVDVTGKTVRPERLGWIKPPLQVLINVYTARLKDPNNLLNCDFFEDDIAKLQQKPLTLACKLIEGDN